jgi:hypothetical protein
MKSHMVPKFVANYTHISERWLANRWPCGHLLTWDTCTVRRNTTLPMFPHAIRFSWFRVFQDILSAYQPTTVLTALHPNPCLALISCTTEDIWSGHANGWPSSYGPPPQNGPPEWLISSHVFLFTKTQSPRCAMDNTIHYTFENRQRSLSSATQITGGGAGGHIHLERRRSNVCKLSAVQRRVKSAVLSAAVCCTAT